MVTPGTVTIESSGHTWNIPAIIFLVLDCLSVPAVDNKKGSSRHKQDWKDFQFQDNAKEMTWKTYGFLTFSVMFAVNVPKGQSLIWQWQSLIW